MKFPLCGLLNTVSFSDGSANSRSRKIRAQKPFLAFHGITESRNHVSLHFYVKNYYLIRIRVIAAISREIMLKLTSFSFKITINGENCQSRISRFTKMVRSKITFMLLNDSQNILENFGKLFRCMNRK